MSQQKKTIYKMDISDPDHIINQILGTIHACTIMGLAIYICGLFFWWIVPELFTLIYGAAIYLYDAAIYLYEIPLVSWLRLFYIPLLISYIALFKNRDIELHLIFILLILNSIALGYLTNWTSGPLSWLWFN